MSTNESRSPGAIQVRYILRPNNSLSWQGSMLCLMGLCAASGSVAIGLTFMGFWMVLPFAGLELLAVGSGFYVVSRRCQYCEVIDITDTAIHVARGYNGPEECLEFSRHWAQVSLKPCTRDWYPSRLLLSAHGKGTELGRFLSESERRQLAIELRRNLWSDTAEAIA